MLMAARMPIQFRDESVSVSLSLSLFLLEELPLLAPIAS